jgi:3-hydroxyisobutyrate dehydrogenase
MTGAQPGAEAGTLTLMCGGRADAVTAATPVMRAYARRIVHVGKAGTGQATKMVNQIAWRASPPLLPKPFVWPRPSISISKRSGGDQRGRRAKLADGQSLAHDGAGKFDFGFAID